MGMAAAFPPLLFQKWGNGGEMPLHHWRSSRQFFWGAKDLFLTFAYKVSATKIIKTFFWCDLQRGLHVFFCKTLAPFF